MLAVVKIYEETLEVGQAVSADSWESAYQIAQEFVLNELEARGVDVNSDPQMLIEIQEILKGHNDYLFSEYGGDCNQGCEQGKAVAVQIIEIE